MKMKNGEILITILIVVFLTAAATTFFLDKLYKLGSVGIELENPITSEPSL